MKQLILNTLLLFLIVTVKAQQDTGLKYGLEFSDVYIIKIRIDSTVLKAKCYCIYPKTSKCNLYRVSVQNVIYCSKGTIIDSNSLLKIKYIAAPTSYIDSLKNGNFYLISARPSTSVRYLALTRILPHELKAGYNFYHQFAYLSALTKCKKKRNPFDMYVNQQPQ